MFVNILRIASPLEFFLPSFLPSRKRSLLSSFKEKVFSNIRCSPIFFFFFFKLNKVCSTPPSKRIVHPIHDSTTILLQLSIFLAYFDSNIYTL